MEEHRSNSSETSEAMGPAIRRVLLGLCGLLVTAIVIASIAAYVAVGQQETTEPLRATVQAVADQSQAVTDRFLEVAESSAGIIARTESDGRGVDDGELRRTMERIVAEQPDIDGAFVGWPTGDFLYVTRSLATEPQGYRIKTVRNADTNREVYEEQVTADFVLRESNALPNDEYDPRTRPWYTGGAEQLMGWTDTYRFASSNEPGITHYRRVDTNDELQAVIGIDMRLRAVQRFLSGRTPGSDGVAAIVSPTGAVVAGNDVPTSLLDQARSLELNAETGEPVLGPSGEEGRVSVVAPIGENSGWTLVVSATADDFGPSFRAQARRVRGILPLLGLTMACFVAWMTMAASGRVNRLQRLANRDHSTGLHNRSSFQRRMLVRLRSGSVVTPSSLVVIELAPLYRHSPEDRDAVLSSVVEEIESLAADVDAQLVGRVGEHRLALLSEGLPALDVANATRHRIEANEELIAAGLADYSQPNSDAIDVTAFLVQAEQALAKAHDDDTLVAHRDVVFDSLRLVADPVDLRSTSTASSRDR